MILSLSGTSDKKKHPELRRRISGLLRTSQDPVPTHRRAALEHLCTSIYRNRNPLSSIKQLKHQSRVSQGLHASNHKLSFRISVVGLYFTCLPQECEPKFFFTVVGKSSDSNILGSSSTSMFIHTLPIPRPRRTSAPDGYSPYVAKLLNFARKTSASVSCVRCSCMFVAFSPASASASCNV